jgi:hypothetical protein
VKTFVAVFLGVALGLAAGSCKLESSYRSPHLTGTCEGACDHYLGCKHNSDPSAKLACTRECAQVFQDEESLRGFESLECSDTIEYVEGDSGRGPGQMVGGGT